MNWHGSGFIAIINYAVHSGGGNVIPPMALLTESFTPILTEEVAVEYILTEP